MLIAPKRRTLLNRADPRVRGRVTWFPLDGHGRNMGDRGGGFVLPSGTTFTSGGDAGPLAKGSSSNVAATCSAGSMGIAGNARRTIFLRMLKTDDAHPLVFWGLGTNQIGQDFTWHRDNNQTTNEVLNGWGNDFSFQVAAGGGNYDSYIVVTVDETYKATAYAKSIKVSSTSGATVGDIKYYTTTTTLANPVATPASALLYYSYWPAYADVPYDAIEPTRLRYFGILGGTIWTAAEAKSWLDRPDGLWQPSPAVIGIKQRSVAAALASAPIGRSAATGTLTSKIQLASNAVGRSAATAALTTVIALSSAAAATSTGTGALSTAVRLSSASTANSTATADLTTAIGLSSSASGQSSAQGTLSTSIPLASNATAASTTTATLTAATQFASAAAATSTATGALTTAIQIASAPAAVSATTATLSTAIPLATNSASVSSATAALSVGAGFATAATSTSTASAQLSTQITLSSAASASSAAVATLSVSALLASNAVASASANGQLSTQIRLQANAVAVSTAMATINGTPAFFQSVAVSTSTATANLTARTLFSGYALTSSAASGNLTTGIALATQPISQSSASAQLSIAAGIRSYATATSVASAELTTSIRLSSASQARSFASGTLNTTIKLASSPKALSAVSASLTTYPAPLGPVPRGRLIVASPRVRITYVQPFPNRVARNVEPKRLIVAGKRQRVITAGGSMSLSPIVAGDTDRFSFDLTRWFPQGVVSTSVIISSKPAGWIFTNRTIAGSIITVYATAPQKDGYYSLCCTASDGSAEVLTNEAPILVTP